MELKERIGEIWVDRESLDLSSQEVRGVISEAIDGLDSGTVRVAEYGTAGEVVVHEWLKQAILLLFRVSGAEVSHSGPFEFRDKIPLKGQYEKLGVRVVPGASARWGAYLAPGVTMMPSYVNIGARVGGGTMVDTWATVGSCAQIGERVHLAGGVGIGGVLEPPQAAPVFIDDDAFIGSRAMITEGARVGSGAVVGAGVILNPSIPVIDTETGLEVSRGVIPPWCVAVAGSRKRAYPGGEFYLPCVLIIKRMAEGERHDKAALNAFLRDEGIAL